MGYTRHQTLLYLRRPSWLTYKQWEWLHNFDNKKVKTPSKLKWKLLYLSVKYFNVKTTDLMSEHFYWNVSSKINSINYLERDISRHKEVLNNMDKAKFTLGRRDVSVYTLKKELQDMKDQLSEINISSLDVEFFNKINNYGSR